MSHGNGGPKAFKIVKHEQSGTGWHWTFVGKYQFVLTRVQPGTGSLPIIPIIIWRRTFVGKITICTHKG